MRFVPFASLIVVLLTALPASTISLRPLGIDDYEAAFGVQRRSLERHWDLEPKDQVELFYGEGNDDGTLALANLTLKAPLGLPIVLLERFDSLTEAVDCNDNDGLVSLTFKTQDAFKRSLTAWDFVNGGEDQKFLVLANHEGCGMRHERQPYVVTKLAEYSESLTTHLISKPVQWSDIATDYKLSFGNHEPFRPSIRGRQAANVVADNILQKRAGRSHTTSFNVNIGAAGSKNIFTSANKQLKVDCADCYAKGKVRATFNYEIQGNKFVAMTMSVSPQDLVVQGTLTTTLSSKNLVQNLGKDIDLIQTSIPGAGVTLPGVANFGFTALYQIGISATFQGSGSFDTNIKASAPGPSLITIDALKPLKSKVEGWSLNVEGPTFTNLKLENEASFSIASQPKLSFGLGIANKGPKLAIEVSIPLPKAEVKMTPTYQPSGIKECGGSTAGVVIKTTLSSGVEASVQVPGLGSTEIKPGSEWPNWTKWEKALVATCVKVPGGAQGKLLSAGSDSFPSMNDEAGALFATDFDKDLGDIFTELDNPEQSSTIATVADQTGPQGLTGNNEPIATVPNSQTPTTTDQTETTLEEPSWTPPDWNENGDNSETAFNDENGALASNTETQIANAQTETHIANAQTETQIANAQTETPLDDDPFIANAQTETPQDTFASNQDTQVQTTQDSFASNQDTQIQTTQLASSSTQDTDTDTNSQTIQQEDPLPISTESEEPQAVAVDADAWDLGLDGWTAR